MPAKYHIGTAVIPNRFPAITKSGVIAWEEGCLKCPRCVKKDCVYKVYEKRKLDSREMIDSLDSICKDCFRCVQNCPGKLIHKGLNPAYKSLGDAYWTPEIISGIWSQSESAKIPVSGAGYGGPFSGSGFDAMWTDMSEIVRPTRDGIHGREYISTVVDIGRKLMTLKFDADGKMAVSPPPFVEIPLPITFNLLPWSPSSPHLTRALLEAARSLGTMAVIRQSDVTPRFETYYSNIIGYVDSNPDGLSDEFVRTVPVIELGESVWSTEIRDRLRKVNPRIIICVRMSLGQDTHRRAARLVREGADVLHLAADEWGNDSGVNPLFIKDRMKEVHLHLVESGLRDQITVLASGGVAMAEHVAKLIICGADAVSIDIPLLVSMECRVCRRCKDGISCPVDLENVDPAWGAARIKNLMAAWHSQLLEIMGAMGMREVRRLRGEMGRAMFFEDLEKETFASMGKRS